VADSRKKPENTGKIARNADAKVFLFFAIATWRKVVWRPNSVKLRSKVPRSGCPEETLFERQTAFFRLGRD
jgi:hypothetical protein